MPDAVQIHASCVCIGGRGVLLLGKSGSGKSDLALRLIDGGAVLVADDRVDVMLLPPPMGKRGRVGVLVASAPQKLRGMLEARGVGILALPHAEDAPLAMAVELVPRAKVERLPSPRFFDCLGVRLPLHSLYAFDASTCAKIRAALTCKLLSG